MPVRYWVTAGGATSAAGHSDQMMMIAITTAPMIYQVRLS
jgi:hypothetical protein